MIHPPGTGAGRRAPSTAIAAGTFEAVADPTHRLRSPLAALFGALVGFGALAACSSGGDPDDVVAAPTTVAVAEEVTWVELWRDDFDGDAVDRAAWEPYYNTYGDGNAELACLTPDNLRVADGVLTIEARAESVTCPSGSTRRFTSGFIGSREVGRLYPLHGRFEIRARVPQAQGLWPAFWLRHAGGAAVAEVDILEVFHSQRPGQVAQTLHFPESTGRQVFSGWATPPGGGADGWHTYAVEILPDDATGGLRFTFFVDDTVTGTHVEPDAPWRAAADPDAAWDLAVNLAVGGRWVGEPDGTLGWLPEVGRCSLDLSEPAAGPTSCPTDGITAAVLPAAYEIDHVVVSVPAQSDDGQ